MADTRTGPRTRLWWTGTRVLLAIGFLVLTANVVVAGVATQFTDDRVLVVTLAQGVTAEQRQAVKDDCGALPGVMVVSDRGNPDPRVQARFPVRFDIAEITDGQLAALQTCLQGFGAAVRGFETEGDL